MGDSAGVRHGACAIQAEPAWCAGRRTHAAPQSAPPRHRRASAQAAQRDTTGDAAEPVRTAPHATHREGPPAARSEANAERARLWQGPAGAQPERAPAAVPRRSLWGAPPELSVVGLRSGDTLRLGDRIVVQIEDAAVLRRTVYARRVVPVGMAETAHGRRGRQAYRAKRSGRDDTVQLPERGAFPAARAARPTGAAKPSKRSSRGRSTHRRGAGGGKRRG